MSNAQRFNAWIVSHSILQFPSAIHGLPRPVRNAFRCRMTGGRRTRRAKLGTASLVNQCAVLPHQYDLVLRQCVYSPFRP